MIAAAQARQKPTAQRGLPGKTFLLAGPGKASVNHTDLPSIARGARWRQPRCFATNNVACRPVQTRDPGSFMAAKAKEADVEEDEKPEGEGEQPASNSKLFKFIPRFK